MSHRMLTTAIALALTVAASAGAQRTERGPGAERPRGAQQDSLGRRGRGGPERMLLRGITLSADQRAKLAELQTRDRATLDANRPRRQDGPDGRSAQFEKRFEQRVAAVRSILTADQRVQFDENVAELKARRAQGKGRFGGRATR